MAKRKYRVPRFRVKALTAELDRQPEGWALQMSSYTGWKTIRVWPQGSDDPDYTWLYDAGEQPPRHEYSSAHLLAVEAIEALMAE